MAALADYHLNAIFDIGVIILLGEPNSDFPRIRKGFPRPGIHTWGTHRTYAPIFRVHHPGSLASNNRNDKSFVIILTKIIVAGIAFLFLLLKFMKFEI